MPYRSTEIRWFSEHHDPLWSIFRDQYQSGPGISEPLRTDYYLRLDLSNTGIKVREGNHEIKIKSEPDISEEFGMIEQWIKWSNREKENVLNSVGPELLEDWIPVDKKRFKKRYMLNGKGELHFTEHGYLESGCGLEFTEIYFPSVNLEFYTLGLEAFSDTSNSRSLLYKVLKQLNLKFHLLKDFRSCGYPRFLVDFFST